MSNIKEHSTDKGGILITKSQIRLVIFKITVGHRVYSICY